MPRARKPKLRVVEGGQGAGAAIDDVYAAPLEEFVRERNRVAKALAGEGRAEEAAEVRALSKPSVSAWTVNQLARRRPADVEALLAAGESLRRAQLGGGREAFSEAQRAERKAIAALMRAAEDVLAAAGRPASRATLDRIAATLRAGAVDESARELLAAGRLSEDLDATGFGALAGMTVAPRPKAKSDEGKRERLARAREAVRDARAEERELRREATAAERRAKQAREAVEAAEQDAASARARAEAAANAVSDAENELEAIR